MLQFRHGKDKELNSSAENLQLRRKSVTLSSQTLPEQEQEEAFKIRWMYQK